MRLGTRSEPKACADVRQDLRHHAARGRAARGRAGRDGARLRLLAATARASIDPERARAIVAALPPFVTPVGVFVNQPVDVHPERGRRRRGISAVQLHGDEPPAYADALSWPVLRGGRRSTTRDACDGAWPAETTLLLDAPIRCAAAAPGATVDWARAAALARERRVVLAGGLTPDNVADAIAPVRPFGVDVSSGVEQSPGVKDLDKVARVSGERADAFERATMNSDGRSSGDSERPMFGRRDPDARGYFGEFGGRFVPETLVAPIEELERGLLRGARRSGVPRRARSAAEALRRPADAALRGDAADAGRRRRADLPQARGPDAHRRAQDQQRARPGAARRAHGQAPHRRRDRRRPARRRDGDGLRAARPRVPRLHGRRGHGAAGAQRRPHAAARRRRCAASTPAAGR